MLLLLCNNHQSRQYWVFSAWVDLSTCSTTAFVCLLFCWPNVHFCVSGWLTVLDLIPQRVFHPLFAASHMHIRALSMFKILRQRSMVHQQIAVFCLHFGNWPWLWKHTNIHTKVYFKLQILFYQLQLKLLIFYFKTNYLEEVLPFPSLFLQWTLKGL